MCIEALVKLGCKNCVTMAALDQFWGLMEMGKHKGDSPTQQQRLAAACRNGGYQSEIKDLLYRFDYSEAEIREAMNVLSTTASSALEASQAKVNLDYLERIIRGMTLARRLDRSR